jgi:hypothetical protein
VGQVSASRSISLVVKVFSGVRLGLLLLLLLVMLMVVMWGPLMLLLLLLLLLVIVSGDANMSACICGAK